VSGVLAAIDLDCIMESGETGSQRILDREYGIIIEPGISDI
jgi:hypothetical protein